MPETGSFRDSGARVFYHDGAVYRALSRESLADWERLAASQFHARMRAEQKIVDSARADELLPLLEGDPRWQAVLRHETIPFISYPYEWTFGMLRDAAILHLDLLLAALEEGLTMKDATPYNVQWRGVGPLFIDVASFEPVRPGYPWVGYRQFCSLFLNPLMLVAYKNCAFHPWLRGSVDGIGPAIFQSLISLRDLLRPGVFSHVWLHGRFNGAAAEDICPGDGRMMVEIIRHNARSLRRLVEELSWRQSASQWSDYASQTPYAREDEAAKKAFVRASLAQRRWRQVWDLGANTGTYSLHGG
ncbi:MAG: hypothetical protein FJX76_24725 [Armatimonadetes bacterium]|nr:hypothetical protein [Armatimonadota bacterium]